MLMKETTLERAKSLYEAGYYMGPRDPDRNRAFEGSFMICENVNVGVTDDASLGGYCIVGDDLDSLINDAYNDIFG